MSVQNSTHAPASTSPSALPLGRVFTYGLASVAAAVIVNLLVYFVLAALLDLSRDFPSFNPGPITLFTAAGTIAGVLVLAALTSLVRNPLRTYTFVAAGALLLSLIPNLLLMQNPEAMPIPGGTPQHFAVLMIFHFTAAVTHIAVVHRLRLGDRNAG
jgi:hypothetical protein